MMLRDETNLTTATVFSCWSGMRLWLILWIRR